MELCIADENMYLILVLACKNWTFFNKSERVHLHWPDQGYQANAWSLENKEKYRQPFVIEQCFHCQRRCKVEIGSYITSGGCAGV